MQSVADALKAAAKGSSAEETTSAEARPKTDSKPAEEFELPSAEVIRCDAGTVLQPVRGRVIPMEEIPDDTFNSGILGMGVGICPEDDTAVAPFDGTVINITDTQHAIALEANGMELLIHVGIDTVKMNGEGFTCLVNEGDTVQAGQPLLRFSREAIRNAGYSDIVAVMLTNSDDIEDVQCLTK
nr:PTS glucose transporter subunit IIA [Ruminococcus sp.]